MGCEGPILASQEQLALRGLTWYIGDQGKFPMIETVP